MLFTVLVSYIVSAVALLPCLCSLIGFKKVIMKAYQLWKSKLNPDDLLPRGKFFRGIRTDFFRERKRRFSGEKKHTYYRHVIDDQFSKLYATEASVK